MSVLFIIRGLPGSGKSTLARKLVDSENHYEADMFHIVDGKYCFNPAKVKESHEWCLNQVTSKMLSGKGNDCAVSNTFTQHWEFARYEEAACACGYDVSVIDCHGPWENVHNVPEEVMRKMSLRWEPYCILQNS